MIDDISSYQPRILVVICSYNRCSSLSNLHSRRHPPAVSINRTSSHTRLCSATAHAVSPMTDPPPDKGRDGTGDDPGGHALAAAALEPQVHPGASQPDGVSDKRAPLPLKSEDTSGIDGDALAAIPLMTSASALNCQSVQQRRLPPSLLT